MTKGKRLLYSFITLLSVIAIISGCTKISTDSVGSPNPDELKPKGTIQGVLRDSVTQQPIVGAIVDIGVSNATTNERGQFKLENVPATSSSGDGIPLVADSYKMTIDLRGVTSPVAMSTLTTTPRYPDFIYDNMSVKYTSLNDTTNDSRIEPGASSPTGTETNTTSTNHDTPVTGLVSAGTINVGKLAATVKGVVAYSNSKQPVGSGWTVELASTGSSNSETSTGGTGGSGNVVGSTTTDASGGFTFSNVESMQTFAINAMDTNSTYTGTAPVVAPADGETKTLSVQAGNTVLVTSTDALAPTVISVTPENNADITPAATNVVFTFSEPIKQTAYASDTTPSGNGLYDDVLVYYNGTKAGNIAHTIAWNSDFTTLTVSIPTLAPSSQYKVQLTEDANNNGVLDAGEDTNANAVLDIVSLVDSNDQAVTSASLTSKGIVSFTTKGGATTTTPSVTLTNSSSIDFTGVNPILDWLPVSGAKSYNVYRAMNQVWGSTSNSGAYQLIGTSQVSNYTDAAIPDTDADGYKFIEDQQTKLTYNYVVKSVNSDYTESDGSTAVTAEDKVKPKLDTVAGTFVTDIKDGDSSIILSYNEPMDEDSVETAGNYVISVASGTAPTVTTAVYTLAAPYNVTLTLSGSLTQNTLGRTISTGANGILETALGAGDTALAVNTASQTAITAGVDGVLNSVLCDTDGNGVANIACDDTTVGTTITSGANGFVETKVKTGSDDVQVTSLLTPSVTAIRGMNSILGGDDTVTNSTVITVSGVKDVAGNTIDSTGDTQDTAGAVQ